MSNNAELRAFLGEIKLEKHMKAMERAGFDDVSDFENLSADSLKVLRAALVKQGACAPASVEPPRYALPPRLLGEQPHAACETLARNRCAFRLVLASQARLSVPPPLSAPPCARTHASG